MMTTTVAKNDLAPLKQENPFPYDLGVKIVPSKKKKAGVMICCHGYGHCNEIVNSVHSYPVQDHLIGFNFPDYGITDATDHTKAKFGTIEEILPLIYLLKRCAVDLGISAINLYGFSAGGAAIVNALAMLNEHTYNTQLQKIGITPAAKKAIIAALEHGLIILDCPLKSVEEVMALRGKSTSFQALAANYKRNNMRPIDSVNKLSGLSLNILLYFENPDDILGNTDDQLFIDRLTKANSGKTKVVIGHDGGHNTYHSALWKAYRESAH